MKTMIHNDRICGGVAASDFNAENLSCVLDLAFADGRAYEVSFDELQTWFQFSLVGEPECPEKIILQVMDQQTHEVINDEGLSAWGLCQKAAEYFLHLLVNEYGYYPVSR